MDVPLAPELTIRDHFSDDHRCLEGLFVKVAAAIADEGPEAAARSWAEFERSVSAHIDGEEGLLFPRLLAARPREARALLAEHNHLRARLAELFVGFNRGSMSLRTAVAFLEELRAHARHEETVLYPWATKHFTQAESKALFERLAERAGERSMNRFVRK